MALFGRAARLFTTAVGDAAQPDALSGSDPQPSGNPAAAEHHSQQSAHDSASAEQRKQHEGQKSASKAHDGPSDGPAVALSRDDKRARWLENREREKEEGRPRGWGGRSGRRGSGKHRGTDAIPLAAVKVDFPVRLNGFGRLAMRRDVQRLLADCNLSADEIRIEFDMDSLNPKGFLVNLTTEELQQRALNWDRSIIAGRAITVEKCERDDFRRRILNPLCMGSRGRYLLVSGIQENATLEDLARFFQDYSLMGNPVTILKSQPKEGLQRSSRGTQGTLRAVVRLTTTEEAHRAVRQRQQAFLLNMPLTLRILQ